MSAFMVVYLIIIGLSTVGTLTCSWLIVGIALDIGKIADETRQAASREG